MAASAKTPQTTRFSVLALMSYRARPSTNVDTAPERFRLTSLALSCVSNMVGRGRELQGEWPRSLYADHASFSA